MHTLFAHERLKLNGHGQIIRRETMNPGVRLIVIKRLMIDTQLLAKSLVNETPSCANVYHRESPAGSKPEILVAKHVSHVFNRNSDIPCAEVLKPVDGQIALVVPRLEGSCRRQAVAVNGRRFAVSRNVIGVGQQLADHRDSSRAVNDRTASKASPCGNSPLTRVRSTPTLAGPETAANRTCPEGRNSIARMPPVASFHSA